MRRWFATVYTFGAMVGNHHLKAWALYLVGLALACTGLWWTLGRNR